MVSLGRKETLLSSPSFPAPGLGVGRLHHLTCIEKYASVASDTVGKGNL